MAVRYHGGAGTPVAKGFAALFQAIRPPQQGQRRVLAGVCALGACSSQNAVVDRGARGPLSAPKQISRRHRLIFCSWPE